MIGRLLYGALFVVALPALLIAWARATAPLFPARSMTSPGVGWALIVAGAALVVLGWIALRVHGGGLPMNAFPPPRYASRGIYALVSHPIYVGFSAIVLGVSLATGSASGAWLVTPTIILASVALVEGYERHDLRARFGEPARPWLSLPGPSGPITMGDRAFVWICVLLPWGAIYEAIASLGTPRDAIDTSFSFERTWPVLEWTEAIYASTYVVALASPLLVNRREALRKLAIDVLFAMALVFPLYLAFPFIAPPRPLTPTTFLGELLARERALDTPTCALPSFHVIFALVLAEALASRTKLVWVWAAAVIASCVTTGMHTLVDVATGVLTWVLVRRASAIWDGLRAAAERVANSWKERELGSVRIINHGAWAALGTCLALAIVGSFVPRPEVVAIVWAGTMLGAAAWAQWLEGASGLSRPYGFWGGVLGALAGGLASTLVGADPWTVLAASCVSAPFVQSAGRLRCLVQGCCHGSAATARVGIVYKHPRSRVAKVPELFGHPIHPTPLYSILWNVPIALAMTRLAWAHAPAHLLVGVYLGLSGIGRFVEESYRGEPQTPIVARLRVYQWIAIAALIAGAIVTATGKSGPMPSPSFQWKPLAAALALGLLNVAAFGVDFPRSKRRFSRLA